MSSPFSYFFFLPPTFGQHWRQETGLHGPATAKIIKDALDQTFVFKEEKLAVTVLFQTI